MRDEQAFEEFQASIQRAGEMSERTPLEWANLALARFNIACTTGKIESGSFGVVILRPYIAGVVEEAVQAERERIISLAQDHLSTMIRAAGGVTHETNTMADFIADMRQPVAQPDES